MHATATKRLELTGILDQFESFEVTPGLGTEFPTADVAQWITSPDSDALLRDLAILVAQRGVVFFRSQTNMDGELQKALTHRMGLLSGKPANHRLLIHPMYKMRDEDPELPILKPLRLQQVHGLNVSEIRQKHSTEWHSDHSFEACPPDFTVLRMANIPPSGGDTLWASCYELYDRLSTPYQKFFESLTAIHEVPSFRTAVDSEGFYKGPRGAPENTDLQFRQNHPMVRTHPVTGWKALFAGGHHCRRINGLTTLESQEILDKILRLVADNHDVQVRFRWNNAGDMAIWDNRCVMHCPTQDGYDMSNRLGYRTVGVGERPFLDPVSLSRAQARAIGQ